MMSTPLTVAGIPGGDRVFAALKALLGRAGLSYSGDFVQVEGHRLHYLTYGPTRPAGADAGPPVVLVHGAGPGAGHWYRQIAALRERRRVLALDSPVFGLSDLVRIDSPPTSLGSRVLAGFLDALGVEIADIVGLSLGGAAALRLALERPERVRRLVLIDSAGLGRDLPFGWRLATVPLLGRVLLRPGRRLRSYVFRRYEVERTEDADAPFYLEYSLAVQARPGRKAVYRQGMRRFAGPRGQREVFSDEELAAIRAPTLLVWGERDRVLPVRHGERAAGLIPGARLEVAPDAGHVSIWDAPDRINALLREFLALS